jgi:hypothetical protein
MLVSMLAKTGYNTWKGWFQYSAKTVNSTLKAGLNTYRQMQASKHDRIISIPGKSQILSVLPIRGSGFA